MKGAWRLYTLSLGRLVSEDGCVERLGGRLGKGSLGLRDGYVRAGQQNIATNAKRSLGGHELSRPGPLTGMRLRGGERGSTSSGCDWGAGVGKRAD